MVDILKKNYILKLNLKYFNNFIIAHSKKQRKGGDMIFAIEGPCYAGKTSLVKKLSISKNNITVIPEYNEIAGGAKNFPAPPKNKQETLLSSRFFLELEKERQILIKNGLNDGKLIIQDRSFFSCIAFDYASAMIGDCNIWVYSEKMFLKNKFVLPDIIFYLDVSYNNIIKRMSTDSYKISGKLINYNFNNFFKKYFNLQVSQYAKIFWINANNSADNIYKNVLCIIDSIICKI